MKWRIYVYMLLLLGTGLVRAADKPQSNICFYRYEDNGVLNIRPSHIRMDGKPLFTLYGGTMECRNISHGEHEIQAYSSDPYDPHVKDENAWASKKLQIVIVNEKKIYIKISPISKDAAYTGPWNIEVSASPPRPDDFEH